MEKIDIKENEKMIFDNIDGLGSGIFIIIGGKTYYLSEDDFNVIDTYDLNCMCLLHENQWNYKEFKLLSEKFNFKDKFSQNYNKKSNSVYTLEKWIDFLHEADLETLSEMKINLDNILF